MSKLKIVTEEKEGSLDTLYIVGKENPYLGYNTKIDNNEVRTVVSSYGKSPNRPLHCSELFNILKSRSWNKTDGCRYVLPMSNGDSKFFIRTYDWGKLSGDANSLPTGEIDELTPSLINSRGIITASNRVFELVSDNYTSEESISEKYKELFGNMANIIGEVTLYNSAKNIIDISEGKTTVFNLIGYNSDTYTDTVDFNPFIALSSKSGVKGLANITVQYSKNEKIYNHNTTVQVFKFDEGNSSSVENFIEEVGKDIQIEYINGVLSVFPNDSDINECVIVSCTLIYEINKL